MQILNTTLICTYFEFDGKYRKKSRMFILYCFHIKLKNHCYFLFQKTLYYIKTFFLCFSMETFHGNMQDSHIISTTISNEEKKNINKYTIKFVQNQLSPRFIKSHMPFNLLPTVVNSDCKVFTTKYYIF